MRGATRKRGSDDPLGGLCYWIGYRIGEIVRSTIWFNILDSCRMGLFPTAMYRSKITYVIVLNFPALFVKEPSYFEKIRIRICEAIVIIVCLVHYIIDIHNNISFWSYRGAYLLLTFIIIHYLCDNTMIIKWKLCESFLLFYHICNLYNNCYITIIIQLTHTS